MADDPEPAVNISGGPKGGGRVVPGGDDGVATRAAAMVDRLGDLYWRKAYGGQDAFTCLVRTILSQNTSDVASQPAHDALLERYGPQGDPLLQGIAGADRETLASTIRPAGLYNRKARVLVGAAHEVLEAFEDAEAFDDFVEEGDPATVRDRLLSIEGVGPKTADCVLLFAGGRDGFFPVDTHVHRLYRRLGIAPPDADHEEVRAVLEREVPPRMCGFGHTASIQFGREFCTARSPACLDGLDACPLADRCERVGVDVASGTVVDPAEAGERSGDGV